MTRIAEHDDYLAARTGSYDKRAIRYRATGTAMKNLGLDDSSTMYDIGAGWTELDVCLRTEFAWRGRYIPVDGSISDVDLNHWEPERHVEFVAALEILEHLHDPVRLIRALQARTTKAIVVSVPDPDTVDVLGIDDTHVTLVTRQMLEREGFTVSSEQFYGGFYSGGLNDALFGIYRA